MLPENETLKPRRQRSVDKCRPSVLTRHIRLRSTEPSPGVGFLALPAHAWWPRFWALASILVNARDRDIDDLVGLEGLTGVNYRDML